MSVLETASFIARTPTRQLFNHGEYSSRRNFPVKQYEMLKLPSLRHSRFLDYSWILIHHRNNKFSMRAIVCRSFLYENQENICPSSWNSSNTFEGSILMSFYTTLYSINIDVNRFLVWSFKAIYNLIRSDYYNYLQRRSRDWTVLLLAIYTICLVAHR